ncbi:response regulator [Sphingomonas colocasiae]|uniref:Response regulator n=1 Tax=Sphingomonas colocasiae TaxID=1848973 RepID=A0ABS7PI95_9SPHN|nr:response regulator [Sphingomonas colocasiae]MBY8820968.1 response regulator [Sphingomonas colocasiae]
MTVRALIVEDEILVALDLESALMEIGIEVAGIAADRASALRMAEDVDFALVDVNLRDGQTGPSIGRALAMEHGVKVIFVTANPSQLGDGIEGTMGVMCKPFSDESISATVAFLTASDTRDDVAPPRELKLFQLN